MKHEVPAFPVKINEEREFRGRFIEVEYPGMSLRDWFAGQALRGIKIEEQADLEYAAEEAYRISDAMLKAREES